METTTSHILITKEVIKEKCPKLKIIKNYEDDKNKVINIYNRLIEEYMEVLYAHTN